MLLISMFTVHLCFVRFVSFRFVLSFDLIWLDSHLIVACCVFVWLFFSPHQILVEKRFLFFVFFFTFCFSLKHYSNWLWNQSKLMVFFFLDEFDLNDVDVERNHPTTKTIFFFFKSKDTLRILSVAIPIYIFIFPLLNFSILFDYFF